MFLFHPSRRTHCLSILPAGSKARLNVEKVQGYSLSEIVATYRQRTELPSYILVVDWFEQAFRALAAIHATGRLHGSIGLEKIFVGGRRRSANR